MVDVYAGDNEAIVKVSDTGIGIPAEDIPIYSTASSE